MMANRLVAATVGFGIALALSACSEDPARPRAHLEGDVAEVRGTVVLAIGAGLPGATVELARNGVVSRSAKTDADGQYAIGVPESGTWELQLTLPVGYALPPGAPGTILVNFATGEVVTLDLDATHNLTVAVGAGATAAADTVSEPGVPVWVRVAGESMVVASGETNEQGFVPFALPPGTYDVGIDIPAGFTLNPKTPSPPRVELVEGVPQSVGFFLVRD